MPLFYCLSLCSCVGMSGLDGDSTKQWASITFSKRDLEGEVIDVCFRLNLKFAPAQALGRIAPSKSCIDRCCWYSETKTVELRFNDGIAEELHKTGRANKYEPDVLKIYMRYSPFLKTLHVAAEPNIVRSDGLVSLAFFEIPTIGEGLLNVGFDNIKAKNFDGETPSSPRGEVIFERDAFGNVTVNKSEALKDIEARKAKEAAEAEGNLEGKELLGKKLDYERRQAVNLVKRFYGNDIDAYIRSIDKAKKKEGLILLANDRGWSTVKTGSPVYRVSCKVEGKIGTDIKFMNSYPVPCGAFEADLDEKTVKALDSVAVNIVSKEWARQ